MPKQNEREELIKEIKHLLCIVPKQCIGCICLRKDGSCIQDKDNKKLADFILAREQRIRDEERLKVLTELQHYATHGNAHVLREINAHIAEEQKK